MTDIPAIRETATPIARRGSMNRRDEVIREKILGYRREIEESHRHFQERT